jgi:hypothetical protein
LHFRLDGRLRPSGRRCFASREVAEHRCGGEFVWVAHAREQLGVSWMIEDRPYTPMEVLDEVPPAVAGWVIGQTLEVLAPVFAVLGEIARGVGADGTLQPDPRLLAELESDERFGSLAELAQEFALFAHAATQLAEQMERLRVGIFGEGDEGGRVRPAA